MKTIVSKLTLVCVSLVVISLIFTGISYAKIDPGTVKGIWLFDEVKGDVAKDSSGNGNDGALMKGPKWVAGKFGTALEFDGASSYVVIKHSKSLEVDTNFSLVYWVKIYDMKEVLTVCKHRQANPNTEGWLNALYPGGTGTLLFQLRPGGVCCTNLISKTTLKKDTWYHVASTYNNKEMRLYIDGVEDASSPLGCTGNISGTQDIHVAHDVNIPGSGLLKGVIDEVAVFNVAITKNDVNTITKGFGMILGIFPSGKLTTAWGKIKAQY